MIFLIAKISKNLFQYQEMQEILKWPRFILVQHILMINLMEQGAKLKVIFY